MAPEGEEAQAPADDGTQATRNTWLAAERTWLAWWRTGLGAAVVAIAIGRLIPVAEHGVRWPFRVVGVGFGLLAIAALVAGAVRQRRTAAALRRGTFVELSTPLVTWLTVAAVVLSVGTIVIVAVRL